MTKTQKERLIAKTTERAIEGRDLYIQEQIDNLVDALETAKDEVKTANTAEKDSGSHSDNTGEKKRTSSSYVTFGNLLDTLKSKRENVKIHNYEQLNDFIDKSLKEEGVGVTPKTKSDLFQHLNHYDKPEKEKNIGGQIREMTEELQENNSQTMTNATNATYKQGIYDGIETLAKGKVPGYADLTESEMNKLAGDVFKQTDADTLDSLANSNDGITKVNKKLADEIRKNIESETDLDKAFNTAKAHMKSNARTELVRAYTQGQIELYKAAGIKNFIWQLRGVTCPVCMPLAGKIFALNEPAPPKHHNCDCYIVPGIAPEKKERNGKVNYNGKTVSDKNIRDVLQRIADKLGADVNVTSGDRNYVPPGGSLRSDHLKKRAADFLVSGKSLKDVFEELRNSKSDIFDKDKRYQVIHHGKYTGTGGPHIHIGRQNRVPGIEFKNEGVSPETKGRYNPVEITRLK